jgi:4-amino-4-deoxy-L-arabinose transferase
MYPFLALAFTLFASHNPLQIKTYKDNVAFAKSEKEGGIDHFMTYDMLLPSVAFYLDQEVITIVDNTQKVDRETQFQHDETYKNTLIDLTNEKEQLHLLQLLQNKKNVFLFQVKDSIPPVLNEPVKVLGHSKVFGKYILYY